MKLVLIEERNNQQKPERSFEHLVTKVGRDPAECHLVFDQSEWPMVSRRHAEFRAKDGRCLLADTNSSYGTFINGQRIMQPVELQPGMRVQFGAGGPVVLVARIEMTQAKPGVDFAEMETHRDMAGKPATNEGQLSPQPPAPQTAPPPAPAAARPVQPAAPVQPAQQPPVQTPYQPAAPQPPHMGAPPPMQQQQRPPQPPPPAQQPPPVQQRAAGPPPQQQQQQQPAPPQPPHRAAAPPPHSPQTAQPQRQATPPPPTPPRPVQQQAPKGPAQPAIVEFVRGSTGKLERIQVTKDVVRLGRDPEMEVAIDAAAAVVSRRHAEIQRRDGQSVLVDLGSFNGTLLNDQRITVPTPLFDGDRIQLGMGGPLLRFVDPSHPAPAGAQHAGQRSVVLSGAAPALADMKPPSGPLSDQARPVMQTMVFKQDTGSLNKPSPSAGGAQPQLLMQLPLVGRTQLTIGRATDNDISLDGLQISNHHARLLHNNGQISIEDSGSTNGVYVNGTRINGRRPLQSQDIVQIGPFVLQSDPQRGVAVFDTRSKTRIDVIDITKEVPNRSGGGMIKLLDDVDLTIQPNEFVGLLGPSGAGKSTLMDSLNGMRPATAGHVLINNLDLYQHLDSLKQSIGYVPQDDIIHRELTVYRTLYYVARLRLSRDISTQEIDQIVGEVMDVTGLSERRDVPVGQLSGGQRKRVSIAVELITKPSVIFLDEPTSGLDPATEEKIMKLFRQIAESGRTVILTTHAMENVKLFDKIVVMMRGKLVWYGAPMDALKHVHADSFKDLYDKLESPIDEQVAKLPPLPPNAPKEQRQAFKLRKEQISEEVAENWKRRFQQTPEYQQNIVKPLSGLKRDAPVIAPARRRPTVTDALGQWLTLARRYTEVLSRDKFNLLILFVQAPIIAFLTYLVVAKDAPRDFPYFMLALVAVWFGTSVSAREIIRERAVYNRERMVNLGLLPYVGSKLFVLSVIVGLQCLLLYGTLKLFHFTGMMKLPGNALAQLLVMILTAMVGIALGLFVSAIVKTSEMATSLVPLILIPQILFSGLVGVPHGVSKAVGTLMPATWSFDQMKRLSALDTVSEEGSDKNGPNEGRGLKKHTLDVNKANIEEAKQNIQRYKQDAEDNSEQFRRDMDKYQDDLQAAMRGQGEEPTKPIAPKLGPAPEPKDAVEEPDNLDGYVNFLHPWGNPIINPAILLLMFFGLVGATIAALRSQDIG